jgi:single-strand DNA-binding protein
VSNINHVVLSGRLTRDPELRTTPSGMELAKTGIAVEGYSKDADADNQPVGFFDLTIFGKFADLVSRKARKGDAVTVEGKLSYSSWETDDGSKRSKVEVIVNQMEGEFLYRKADGSDTPARTEGNGNEGAASGGNQQQSFVPPPADDDIPF